MKNKIKNSKKAMSEEQFRWIFILIAGAIILGFFTSIIIKQKQAQEENIAAAELQNMEFLMANAKLATGSSEEVELFQEIKFDCDSIKTGKLSKQIREPIFSPKLLKGRKLITWTLDWNMPYKATNFLFLTTDEARYIFVYDKTKHESADTSYKNFFEKVYSNVSEKINKEKVSDIEFNSVGDKNNYKTKIVFFDLEPVQHNLKGDISVLKIEGADLEEGRLLFYEKGAAAESRYLGLPSLYGAIFSENKKDYECSMGKAFRKLNLVSLVYYEKLSNFGNNNKISSECNTIYGDSKGKIKTIWEGNMAILKDSTNNYQRAKNYKKTVEELKMDNDKLLKASCPSIY